ncbi:hypothetical protein D9M72_617790 [compost metagenome]
MHIRKPELGGIARQAGDPEVGGYGELPAALRFLRLGGGRKQRGDIGGAGYSGR